MGLKNIRPKDSRSHLLINFVAILIFVVSAKAQIRVPLPYEGSEPRGLPEFTFCSQNLENYGILKDFLPRNVGSTELDYTRKQEALAARFASENCDVIAVQELLGRTEDIALEALKDLADVIRRKNNRFYQAIVGPTNDSFLRVGYLLAVDRVELLNKASYYKVELPKLSEDEKTRLFSRGPLELQVRIKGLENSYPKIFSLVTFHFKSRSNSSKDPSRTGWESFRMEMAEGLRRVIETRHAKALNDGEELLLIAGDRNSHMDTASAALLEGRVRLKDFEKNGVCRLSKRGVALCQPGAHDPQIMFSLLTGDPQTKQLPGTFRYKKVYSWLDDILGSANALKFARAKFDSEGDYDSGVVYTPSSASDHAMVWARFNW